jgi:hypothetical protein
VQAVGAVRLSVEATTVYRHFVIDDDAIVIAWSLRSRRIQRAELRSARIDETRKVGVLRMENRVRSENSPIERVNERPNSPGLPRIAASNSLTESGTRNADIAKRVGVEGRHRAEPPATIYGVDDGPSEGPRQPGGDLIEELEHGSG